MGWRGGVNRALAATAGVELQPSYRRGSRRRAASPDWTPQRGGRLVPDPVFIISSVRSGSTLLRLMLNAHSQIHAPHELHLTAVGAEVRSKFTSLAMDELGLSELELQHLLWDRILHRELDRAGKSVLVEKTPNNALGWRRLARCWPEARYVFLLRHPVTTVHSWHESQAPRRSWDENLAKCVSMMNAVEDARTHLPGVTVRYEDVTADPARELQRLCSFLDVPWEPTMLDYGRGAPHTFKAGIGDWREKIRSGRVQPPRPLPPGEPPPELAELCVTWGYS
ncbi:MAG: sulfotransferase family protein [Sporichthyaceae bacterium]